MARARRTPDPIAELADALRAGGGSAADQLTALAAALVAHDGLDVVVATLPVAHARRSSLPRRTAEGGSADDVGHRVDDAVVVPALLDAVAAARATTPAADLVGQVHEALLDADHRRAHGVHYTPPAIAAGVAALALDLALGPAPAHPEPPEVGPSVVAEQPPGDRFRGVVRVCDPACGGGAFLLAAGRLLERDGAEAAPAGRAAIVDGALFGVDVDPTAVAVARTALILWAAEAGEQADAAGIVVADTLLGRPPFPSLDDGLGGEFAGFDAVVGNPPFQNQLERSTARQGRADAEAIRRRFGADAYRYTDTAALFVLEACRWARPGGHVALVLPQSLLAAADAARVRRSVLDHAALTGLWVAGEDVFAASVRVCAPVLTVLAPPAAGTTGGAAAGQDAPRADDLREVPVRLWRGPDFEPVEAGAGMTTERLRNEPSWAVLTRALHGVPAIAGGEGPTLGSFCTATAGFRDQYYGLSPYVREADVEPTGEGAQPVGSVARLVTSGLIDPAACTWGERPARFAGVRWQAPVVDLDALADGDPTLDRWTRRVLVPKVVVATQTRVLEAAVDTEGTWFPSVPTLAVVPEAGRLWDAAAVVCAPAISAWAFARHAGAALSSDAVKVSARQLLDAPLPTDAGAWAEGAALLEAAAAAAPADRPAALAAFGAAMGTAYGVGDDVLAWWSARLPGALVVPA